MMNFEEGNDESRIVLKGKTVDARSALIKRNKLLFPRSTCKPIMEKEVVKFQPLI